MTSLDQAAHDRKARLSQLRAKRKRDDETTDDKTQTEETGGTMMRYRNYDAESKDAKLGFLNSDTLTTDQTLEQRAKELEKQIKQDAEDAQKDVIDLLALQPKKPNWDLKRELQLKLDKLKPKQDATVLRLIRERLQAQKQGVT